MILLQRLTASLTVANSDSRSYATYFNPELQNIVKSDNDQTSVAASSLNLPSGFNQVYLRIDQPIVNMHYGEMQAGYPNSEAYSVNGCGCGSCRVSLERSSRSNIWENYKPH